VVEGAAECRYCGRLLPQPDLRERLELIARAANDQLKQAGSEGYQGRVLSAFLGSLGATLAGCWAVWQGTDGWPLRLVVSLGLVFAFVMTFGFAVTHYEERAQRETWERKLRDEVLARLAELDTSPLELSGLAVQLLGGEAPLVKRLRS
jgi:hypothetical protein